MKQTIVIPVTNGILSEHFGHCEEFYFAEIENKKIKNSYKRIPPEHEPGLYPKWVKEQGGTQVIAGGMGQKARNLFEENKIETIVGAPIEKPEKVVLEYLEGTLKTVKNTCNHH